MYHYNVTISTIYNSILLLSTEALSSLRTPPPPSLKGTNAGVDARRARARDEVHSEATRGAGAGAGAGAARSQAALKVKASIYERIGT